ncbi:zinc finger BED domain-containing protein RICESLEEPER 2-like [Rhizophagus clarus]|uniref:Zinc finger BED domain-containing protein RICESLEEPER 2-like n=1 Tax=Rhizophagus clarus TaxID=94130 RepID=A0A8H3LNT0_9GLOM|nr:zinc finger BED domain-containing protein RICESLEEPER 2-like [Rhizophagus clarus]
MSFTKQYFELEYNLKGKQTRTCNILDDNETAITVFLITDLWSSRAKYGYLSVTATWITSDFKVKDVILEIKYTPSPHTANIVAELLYKCISS